MNRIVRAHYPAASLPTELREGLDPQARVTITIEQEHTPQEAMSLTEMFALRRDVFASQSDIDAYVRAVRNERSD
jgi:hypothetical protein